MNIIKKHIEYLKDNPKGYWFKRKVYGWGWFPATKQGWFVTLIFIIIAIALAININELATGKDIILGLFLPLLLMLIIMIRICYAKGEKPRWQWGFKNIKNSK